MITILTPTYNRAYILKQAYNSLVVQTEKNFEWLIIDDGSKDNTKELVERFINENKIKIRYYKKKNGGKHTALNYGTKKANGELILVLDSDDFLMKEAIEIINKYWKKYKNNNKICGLSFMRKINNPVYKTKKFKECISNTIEFKYNNGNLSDMCEVIKTEVLREFPYPEFEDEKFLSEVIVAGNIAKHYDTVYIPKEIYCTKYLEDGLSHNWLRLVVNNPLGARANNILFMSKDFKFIIRIKNCIMFNIFSIIGKKNIFNESKMKIMSILFYIPSYFIAKILIFKYKNK